MATHNAIRCSDTLRRVVRSIALVPVLLTFALRAQSPGPRFQVNTFTPGTQQNPAAAMNAAGQSVIAWTSEGQDGDIAGVFARRYGPTGAPQDVEFQVNTFTSGAQFEPAVAMDDGGGFVIAWTSSGQDGSALGIFAQRFDAGGTPLGPEFQVNSFTAGSQSHPAIGMDRAGNYVVAWTSELEDGDGLGVFAQRFDVGGAPVGGEFQVNTTTALDQFDPALAMNADGRFVIAWTSWTASFTTEVFAQRFHADGTPDGSEFQVNTSSGAAEPAVGVDDSGRSVFVWLNGGAVLAQAVDAAGHNVGTEFTVDTALYSDAAPALAMRPTREFVVVASGLDQNDATAVLAQLYDANAQLAGAELQVNDPRTAQDPAHPAAAIDSAGNFVVAWNGFDADSDEVLARRFAAAPAGPSLSIGDTRVTEGDSGTVAATFVVTLSQPSIQPVTVDFVIADGTATVADNDYIASAGTLTFMPGDPASKPMTVLVNGDVRAEADETFSVVLANPTNAAIARGRGTGTIVNDDFTISIGDAGTIREGDAGTVTAVFGVALSGAVSRIVTVDFATVDGTATVADNDYVATSGTLTFSPGETAKQVAVVINGDTRNEFDETLFVNLSNPSNAPLSRAQGTATIINDDFGGTSAGNQFRVNLTSFGNQYQPAMGMNAAGRSVIAWTSEVPDASGALTSTGIFAQRFDASGVLQGPEFRVDDPVFAPGEHRQPAVAMDAAGNFVIVWTGGTVLGGLESDFQSSEVYGQRFDANGAAQGGNFVVNGGGMTFSPGAQQRPCVAMYASGEFVVAWDGPGNGSALRVWAQRFDSSGARLGSEFQVDGFTGGSRSRIAVDPAQCLVPPGAPAGCSPGSFAIVWAGAGLDDAAGIFARLFDGSNGLPTGDQFRVNTYTANAQERPALGMDAGGSFVVAWEGEGPGGVRGIFAQRFDRNGIAVGWCGSAVPLPTSCAAAELQMDTSTTDVHRPAVGMGPAGDFVVAWDGLQNPAAANAAIFARRFDASGVANGGAEFLVNQTFALGDFHPAVEVDERGNFVVAWDGGTDGSLSGVFARRFTARPSISIADVRVFEGAAGSTGATFTVTLSAASTEAVSVDFATGDGTATVGDNDYVAGTGVLVFAPGQTTQTITVIVNGDTAVESDETFVVNLTNPTNATIARPQAVGTIVNDDCAVNIADVTVTEGNSGTVPAAFTVSLSCATGQPAAVDFATSNGTAISGDDYVATSGTLTFAPGETSKPITVMVNGDTASEGDETFFVNLSNPTNATITKGQGVGTIRDDDPEQIAVNETIKVTDSPTLTPSVLVDVPETITVADAPNVLPSALINVDETVQVTDTVDARPPGGTFVDRGGVDYVVRDSNAIDHGIVVRFGSVNVPGVTTADVMPTAPLPPVRYTFVTPVFDVTTSASVSGPIDVCLTGLTVAPLDAVFHFEGSAWVDVTAADRTSSTQLCGRTASLSPFVVGRFINHPPTASASAPPYAEATSPAGAAVTLTGTGADPDDDPISFTWTEGGATLGTGRTLTSTLSLGAHDVTLTVRDNYGASASATAHVTVRDTTPPAIAISAPIATMYTLSQIVAASYRCTDAVTPDPSCTGPVANGAAIDTAGVGPRTFTVVARDAAGNRSTASLSYVVGYNVCLLYDPSRAAKSGSTLPIKIALCDAAGANRSAADIVLTARDVKLTGDAPATDVIGAGNANPDSNFRFDPALGGYIFNLSTKSLTAGTYVMTFVASGDPTTHRATFIVR